MKKNYREVPKKNYIILLLMICFIVFITFFIFDINKKYQSRKLESSYLSGYISEVNVGDLNNILTEPSSELFIFVTKTRDEAVYNFEMDLKKVIKNRDLRDNFMYLDYTDGDLGELNEVLGSEVSTIPAIIYFKNGEYVKSIDSSMSMLNSGDFEKLLDEYEVN